MEIRIRHYNDVAIFSLNGRLDPATLPYLMAVFEEQRTAGFQRFVADCKRLDFLGPAEAQQLGTIAAHVRQQAGDLRLANPQPQVKHVLKESGLNGTLKIYSNVVGATASYFPGPLPREP